MSRTNVRDLRRTAVPFSIAIVLGAIWLLSTLGFAAPKPSEVFILFDGPKQLNKTAAHAFETRPGTSRIDYVSSVRISAVRDLPPLFPQAKTNGYTVYYGQLFLGDLARMVDGVYRVERCRPLKMVRVKDSDLPEGIAATKGTYPFSIQGKYSGGGKLHGQDFHIDKPEPNQKGLLRIRIRMRGLDRRVTLWQTVGEGDLVWFGTRAHRLVKIVPTDPKHKIIGWIELEQKVAKTRD